MGITAATPFHQEKGQARLLDGVSGLYSFGALTLLEERLACKNNL